MRKGNASGFTLVELLIYSAVFASVSLTLAYFLTTFFKISGYQASASEVANQANFILQKIEHEVAGASTVTVNDNGDDETDGTLGSPYTKLIMKTSAENGADASDPASPVSIWRDTGTGDVMMKVGNQTATALNKSTVKATSLAFTKVSTPPGKDVVLVSLVLEYQSPTPAERISRQFALGVGKASAAAFDTQITPNATTLDIGSSIKKWRSLYLSQDATIDGSIALTTLGTNTANNSISFMKQGVITVNPPSIGANSSSTITIGTLGGTPINNFVGVLPSDRIFLTPHPDLENDLWYSGANTGTDNIYIKIRNTNTSGGINGAGRPWSYIIVR